MSNSSFYERSATLLTVRDKEEALRRVLLGGRGRVLGRVSSPSPPA